MSAGYLGGGRECRSFYYKPGKGWSEAAARRRRRRFKPSAPGRLVLGRVAPLRISAPPRPGIVTRIFILAIVMLVVFALIFALRGAHGLVV
jgi:hypothetical protein